MLDALDIELAADSIRDYTNLIHTVLAPHYATDKLDNVKEIIENKLNLISNLREYDIKTPTPTSSGIAHDATTQRMVAAFTELEKRGIIKAFQEQATKHFEELNRKNNRPIRV